MPEELHPFTGTSPTNEELFEEIKEKAIRNGVADHSAFSDLVDEVVETKSAEGLYGEDADLEKIKEVMKERYREIQDELEKNRPARLIT